RRESPHGRVSGRGSEANAGERGPPTRLSQTAATAARSAASRPARYGVEYQLVAPTKATGCPLSSRTVVMPSIALSRSKLACPVRRYRRRGRGVAAAPCRRARVRERG